MIAGQGRLTSMHCLFLVIAWCFFLMRSPLEAQDNLASKIDSLVERDFDSLSAPPESDAMLLRRLSLDLRMVVPTQHELDAYLSDGESNRWERWVSKFLDDPLHRERIVDWLDKSLLQRRPFQQVDRQKWLAYLRKVVDEQKPLDAIAKEMVSSVWWNQSERAQQRFFLERAGDSHAIARDIGRVFFGKDMQCAQCHDHPQVSDYLQIDYHGLLAYASPSSFFEAKEKDEKGAEKKVQVYVEKAARDAPFESVFDKGIYFRTGTRAPGMPESFDPFQTPDEAYEATPKPESLDGVPAPPRFSRRSLLVSQLSANNRAFAANWSNRLWAMLMGKGLVHPLDMHHPDNPPNNPRLLDALSDGLIASEFRLRPFIEQVVLSQSYKVGSRMLIESSLRQGVVLDLGNDEEVRFEAELNKVKMSLDGELEPAKVAAQAAKSDLVDADTAWKAIQKERVEVWTEIEKTEAVFKEALKKSDANKAALDKAKKQLEDTMARLSLLDEAAGKLDQARLLGLAEDAELKQAIATAKSKSETTKTSIPALEKAVVDATAAREASNMLLDAERTRVKEIAAKLQPIEQRLHEADIAFLNARSAWQKAHTEKTRIQNRLVDVARILAWLTASRSVRDMETNHMMAIAAVEQAKEKLTAHATRIEQTQIGVAGQTKSKDDMEANLAKATSQKNEASNKIDTLQSTLESLDKSIALVAASEPLQAAKLSIQSTLESLKTNFGSFESKRALLAAELAEQADRLAKTTGQLDAELREMSQLEQQVEQGLATASKCQEQVSSALESCSVAMQAVIDSRQKAGYLAPVRPLSPEQLCLSIFQATNVLQNHVAAELAELDKASPLAEDATADLRQARQLQATRQALDKLRSHCDVFAGLYSSGVGQTSDEFFASPDQALYMANGGTVFQWSAPNGSNVTAQMVKQSESSAASAILFRTLLSRDPTSQEAIWVNELFAQAGEKKPSIAQELVWSLLTSSEFRIYP